MTTLSRDAAVDALRAGGVLLVDTDTLPGLHALATVDGVAGRIAALKGHPPERPYLLLVDSADAAFELGEPVDPAMRDVLRAIWPGALTALLRPGDATPRAWTDRGLTIAIRVPAAPALLGFLTGLGGPLFSTSANLAGQPPAKTLDEARRRFPGIPAVELGIEPREGASTIVDFAVNPPNLIRPGVVPFGGSTPGFGLLDGPGTRS